MPVETKKSIPEAKPVEEIATTQHQVRTAASLTTTPANTAENSQEKANEKQNVQEVIPPVVNRAAIRRNSTICCRDEINFRALECGL